MWAQASSQWKASSKKEIAAATHSRWQLGVDDPYKRFCVHLSNFSTEDLNWSTNQNTKLHTRQRPSSWQRLPELRREQGFQINASQPGASAALCSALISSVNSTAARAPHTRRSLHLVPLQYVCLEKALAAWRTLVTNLCWEPLV